jgi:glycosyltransferase involved in cell wall biosynthesis
MSVSAVDGRRVCAVAYTNYRADPRVRREAEALAARGDSVTVLALREAGHPEIDVVDQVRVVGLPVRRYRGDGVRHYLASYARFFAHAAAHLTRRPRAYDLIHVHSLPEAMVFSAVAPKLGRRPVVLDVQDLSTEVYASRLGSTPAPVRWMERLSLAFADRVVTVHEDYRDRITERGVGHGDITVVLNSPDDRLFPLLPPELPQCPPTLIYHGTFVERYGLVAGLRALAQVQDRIPGVRLSLVGDGDLRPRLAQLIAELGLGPAVGMSDRAVPVEVIPKHIENADVGLVPFLDDPFTRAILPTKLLEYVRMGKPVITSRNPVVEHYFADDDVFFVRPGNVDDIVDAIESIVTDPHGARQRARRAQRFFETNGWPIARARFLAMVDEVMAG